MGIPTRLYGLLLGGMFSTQAFVIRSSQVVNRNKLYTFSNERTATARLGNDSLPNQNEDWSNIRSISSLEKDPRLPVWPVANGVLLWLLGLISPKLAAQVEHVITGRVCPMPLNTGSCSPFVLLVHHVHSFSPWDPIRYIQRNLILPEGFPSHPHRGFVTLTYILDGAFVHRDSLGQRQVYGSTDHRRERQDASTEAGASSPSPSLPHSQWLYTGAGVLHEEMFQNAPWPALATRQELFQLWINCPRGRKYGAPFSVLLGDREVPEVVAPDGATTRVLAGCFRGRCGAAPLGSPLVVLHVRLPPRAAWVCDDAAIAAMATALVYVRRGSLTCNGATIDAHHRAQLDRSPRRIVLRTDREPADFLFLAGEPLGEPVAQEGSFVLNSPDEVNRAYADYQAGYFGRFWDHKLSDEEWQRHVQKFPCIYKSADDK